MNEYKKEEEAAKTSIDKPIGEKGTLADIIQDEKDTLIEQLEEADMTPSVKQESINSVNDLKMVMEMLGFPTDVKNSIMNNIKESNVPLNELTYKGVRDLILQTEKKVTTEKKVVPDAPLFEVLNAVSAEFGIDPLRILAKQDLNSEQRKLAQRYIFDKAINNDGTFNTDILDMLPEGQDRSGRATGVANTKIGELYSKGKRLKVAEGAK